MKTPDLFAMPKSDIDLRKEFEDVVLGAPENGGLATVLIQRRLDKTRKAPGYDPLRGGSTGDPWDKGEAYAWTEKYVLGYFTQLGRGNQGFNGYDLQSVGLLDDGTAVVYLPAAEYAESGDSIFRIRLNEDGSAYYPPERLEKWRVVHALDRRAEDRRLAFWLLICRREEV